MKNKMIMLGASALLAAAVFAPSSPAEARGKNHCKNPNTRYEDRGNGRYACVHKTKFWEQKCASGYTYSNGKCEKTTKKRKGTANCAPLQYKQVRKGKEKCWNNKRLKKFKGYAKCPGGQSIDVDHSGQVDYCVKTKTTTKNLQIDRCPVGFEKGATKTVGRNGHKIHFCETAL